MLFDEIPVKSDRQKSMMAHFQKKADGVDFNQVNVEVDKTSKSDKEKGVIKPPINYICDEHEDT